MRLDTQITAVTKNEKGFTLIEVMGTLFVVVITLVGILYSNEVLGRVNEQTYEQSVAVQDAHQVMEQIREAAQWGFFPQNIQNAFPNGGTVAGLNNLTDQVVTVSYTQAGDLLDVAVNVAWTDPNNRTIQYTLNSFMTQRE